MQVTENRIPTGTLVWRISLRILLVTALLIGLFTVFRPLCRLFLPFILAYAVTALLLAPLLRRVDERFGRRKVLSIVLIVVMLLVLIGGLVCAGYYLVSQVAEWVRNWEDMQTSMMQTRDDLAQLIANYTRFSEQEVLSAIDRVVTVGVNWVKTDLFGVENIKVYMETVKVTAPAVGNFLLGFVFFVIAVYFISAEYPRIRCGLSKTVPPFIRPQLSCIKEAAGSATFGYLRAQVILSAAVALIAFVALLIYGQPFALVIALLIGVIDFFPFFGSSVVTIPWAAVALLQGDWIMALFLMALTFALFLFRKLAEPKIVGDQTGLHPLLSLISIYIGMKWGGIIGMIVMPIVWMAFISLYRAGFFNPTIRDIRMLIDRIADCARLPKEE